MPVHLRSEVKKWESSFKKCHISSVCSSIKRK